MVIFMMTKYVAYFVTICLAASANGNKRLFLDDNADILAKFTAMETHIAQLENRMKQVEQENTLLKNRAGGSTYIRWGKRSCSVNGTSLVYKGYAAGNYYGHTGGLVDTLCLPEDPTWNKYSQVEQYPAYVYGVEVDSTDTKTLFGYDYKSEDIPCALCQTDRPRNVMIPGRATCYPGWTQEYTGYLLAGYHGHASNTDVICLDENPLAVPDGGGIDHEGLRYFVEATCTSLSCPPYVNGRELACVVCSK